MTRDPTIYSKEQIKLKFARLKLARMIKFEVASPERGANKRT